MDAYTRSQSEEVADLLAKISAMGFHGDPATIEEFLLGQNLKEKYVPSEYRKDFVFSQILSAQLLMDICTRITALEARDGR